jgi:predicted dehydrogenase
MRFALLGDHADGLDFVRALTASGRHELAVYSGLPSGLDELRRLGLSPQSIGDLEEVLADPNIDAVIVAGRLAVRRQQLLRALQSEVHVLCVHPADNSPDVAYEAGLIQADTGRVLLPLAPMPLHPGVARLRSIAQARPAPRLLEMEIWSTEDILLEWSDVNHKPGFPGWDVLRAVGGEIGELYAQSTTAELTSDAPVIMTGRFVVGLLFQITMLPRQADARWRVDIVTTVGRATLEFAQGWPGSAQLTWLDENGQAHVESWPADNPWLALLERFEQAVLEAGVKKAQPGQPAEECLTQTPPVLGWQDELRALELDDAARRSVERGRSSTLDLQEATEEATFKGTMTLVGCSLIWLAVIVLILSVWTPWLAWAIVPVFAAFLILQALRWVLPEKSK